MKKFKLFYFSGTGNTKCVSHILKKHLNNETITCNAASIEYYLKNKIVPSIAYDIIGIGYPVYSFNAPRIMMDFIKMLPEGDGRKVFIYQTAGEDSSLNYAASTEVIGRLKDKDYEVISEFIFEMPSNFFTIQKDKKLKEVLRKTNIEIKLAAECLINGTPCFLKKGFLSPIIQKLGKLEQFGDRRIGQKFQVSEACNNCGVCLRNCPRDNIFKKKDKIAFDKDCMLCMRCLYSCPVNAISPSKATGWIVLKEGYDIKYILEKFKMNN